MSFVSEEACVVGVISKKMAAEDMAVNRSPRKSEWTTKD